MLVLGKSIVEKKLTKKVLVCKTAASGRDHACTWPYSRSMLAYVVRMYLSVMYMHGLESPSHFFWDEKCYSQDRSDHSGSDGPAQWREEAIKINTLKNCQGCVCHL